jgi:hypothetical protein
MPSLILRKYHFPYRAVDKFAAGSATRPAPELNQSSGSASAVKSGWIVLFVALTALSPAFLGGDASKYGEVVPVIGTGLLLFVFPLRAAPANSVLIGMAGLLLCGLAGFLTARWIAEPEWHSAIRQAIPGLGNTITLQPLHSLIRFGVMLSAILFAVWVFQWRPSHATRCLQVLCGGIALVATLALAAHFYSFSVPGWHPSQGFGPFPNRNQTATLMALGATLALGLCASSFRRRDWSGIVWVLAFALCLAALLLTNSRAPLCLLLAGSFLWFFKLQRSPLKGFSVAGGVTLLVCAATLLIGENVARRLPDLLFHGPGFRAKIYQDTFRLAWASPALGTGLGNFEAIFPRFRDASLNAERVIHPESDWLWMASEMGWLSILFCVVGIGGLLIREVHSSTRREKELRLAGWVAIAAFLVNSLIDVPGHRLGTILPVLVLASLCARPELFGDGAPILPFVSRIFGIGLVAFGVVLAREANLNGQTERAVAEGEWGRAAQAASESLVRQPLDWSLYVTRGYAEIHQNRWLEANADFRHARFLEPKMAIVPLAEGKAWVGVNRAFALGAWKEALRRSQSAEMRELYGQMLDASLADPPLHLATIRLADNRPSLALLTLDPRSIDSQTLRVLESERPSLSADEILALTRAEAWKAAAETDFEQAYEIGRRAMRNIQFPIRNSQSEEQCRDALIRDPGDFAAAFNLCAILQATQRWQDALGILESISRDSNCPIYLLVLKAEILASQQKWSEAWNTIHELVR